MTSREVLVFQSQGLLISGVDWDESSSCIENLHYRWYFSPFNDAEKLLAMTFNGKKIYYFTGCPSFVCLLFIFSVRFLGAVECIIIVIEKATDSGNSQYVVLF